MARDTEYSGIGALKYWADEDKPREKLRLKGRHALSNAELLSILIGSGRPGFSALDLAKELLSSRRQSLLELGRQPIQEMLRIKGIGDAKAVRLVAAFELGRRRSDEAPQEKPQIRSSEDAYLLLRPAIVDLPHEEFWVLFLNRANRVLHRQRISAGGITGTVVDLKILMKAAIDHLATGMLLAHNHPSGNLRPSQADIDLTKKCSQAAGFFEIEVLDHLIMTDFGYYSFADEGKL